MAEAGGHQGRRRFAVGARNHHEGGSVVVRQSTERGGRQGHLGYDDGGGTARAGAGQSSDREDCRGGDPRRRYHEVGPSQSPWGVRAENRLNPRGG